MNDFTAKIWALLTGLVKCAAEAMAGEDGKAKKAQVVDWACQMVNLGEDLIPVFRWANVPAVDAFERFAISLAVEWCWTQLQLPKEEQHPTVAFAPVVVPAAA